MKKLILALELERKYNKISFEDFVEEFEEHNGIKITKSIKEYFIFSGLDNVSYFKFYIKEHNSKNIKQLCFGKALSISLDIIDEYNELQPIDALIKFGRYSHQLISYDMIKDFPLLNTNLIESDYLNQFNIKNLYQI